MSNLSCHTTQEVSHIERAPAIMWNTCIKGPHARGMDKDTASQLCSRHDSAELSEVGQKVANLLRP